MGELASALAEMARNHRDTVMAGRTHGQHALPITFGFKAAVWLAELQRHRERLQQCKPRLLTGQLAGAAGTLASLPAHGLEVQRRMMEILGLGVPADHLAHRARRLRGILCSAGDGVRHAGENRPRGHPAAEDRTVGSGGAVQRGQGGFQHHAAQAQSHAVRGYRGGWRGWL